MTTTIERYLKLPTSGGAAAFTRTDQPTGAGLAQLTSSNATHLAREQGLRVLYEDPGSGLIGAGLPTPSEVSSFNWDGLDTDAVPGFARFCGVHQIRPYGETGQWPRVELRCRAGILGATTGGLVLVVTRGCVLPSVSRDPYATTTFANALADRSLTVSLTHDAQVQGETWVPRVGTAAVPPEPSEGETGRVLTIGVWVGAWSTANQKAPSYIEAWGLTIFLREPA